MVIVTVSIEGTGEGETIPRAGKKAMLDLIVNFRKAPPQPSRDGVVLATHEELRSLIEISHREIDSDVAITRWYRMLKGSY